MANGANTLDIAQLVAEQHAAVYAYAYRLCGCEPDAEDLTQQVFLVAQQKLGQLRDPSSARAWLFTILRNLFMRWLQDRKRVAVAGAEMSLDDIPAKVPDEDDIDRERLQQAINDLPETFRLVVVMFYFEEASYREIAEALNLPLGTVMSRLARAKSHLRSKLLASDSTRSGLRTVVAQG